MGRTLAFTTEKGGVGKTTSTINVGSYFALRGYKTLLIDFDPQTNATKVIFPGGVSPTIYDALSSKVKFSEIIKKTSVANMDMAPGSPSLAELEVSMISNTFNGPYRLKRLIEDAQLKQVYDFIVIDSSPALGIFTMNVMTASDFLLIPIEGGDQFSHDAVGKVLNSYNVIMEANANPSLKILGGYFNKMDERLSIVQALKDDTKEFFAQKKIHLFETPVRLNVRIKEAHCLGKPIYIHDQDSLGAQDFAALSEEILQRLEELGAISAPARSM